MDVKVEEAEVKDDAESITRRGNEDQGCSELGDRGKCIEAELLDLRKKSDELKERIARLENERSSSSGTNNKSESPKFVDLTAEEEKEGTMFELMIENKALECEKQKAKKDAELWKGKFEELVSWVSGRDEKVVQDLCRWMDSQGPSLQNEIMDLKKKICGGIESDPSSRVRKRLVFEDEDGPAKKIAPPTPGVAKHGAATSTINIDDSDDDDVETDTTRLPTYKRIQKQGTRKRSDSANDVSSVQTPKRKRASRVVTSDTESDDDDDGVPLSRLKKLHAVELSNDGVISRETENARAVSSAVDVDEDDEPEPHDVGSGSEGESLGGFIVSDGDNASTESEDDHDNETEEITNRELEDFSESESEDMPNIELDDGSDSETDYAKVMSTIRRKRDCKPSEWQFEGDMLAAFGKDPELCMKAVCALYRQQTADERVSKEALYNNKRGFSKFDAPRGTKLGDFLTGGDLEGDLKKSVEELQEHDPKAVELCRTMATRYSKQLFEIYQAKEDPFFLPR